MRCGKIEFAVVLVLAAALGAPGGASIAGDSKAGDSKDGGSKDGGSGDAEGAGDEDAAWRALQQPGHAALMRHAHAPGVADDPDMEIDDCATQRALDAQGREQARAIGARLRAHGVDDRLVYTSRMCRAIDTAKLLEVGTVVGLPVLDSYFGDDEQGETIVAGLRTFLRTDPLTPPPILVTHTPNINEMSGVQPEQGGMVVVRVTASGALETVGRIAPPPEPDEK